VRSSLPPATAQGGAQSLELCFRRGDVGLDRLVEQGFLLAAEALAAGAELLPLQLGDLEGQLIDLASRQTNCCASRLACSISLAASSRSCSAFSA